MFVTYLAEYFVKYFVKCFVKQLACGRSARLAHQQITRDQGARVPSVVGHPGQPGTKGPGSREWSVSQAGQGQGP